LLALLAPVISLVDLTTNARLLCADSADNKEYVRGIAELVIDSSYGVLNNDEHKESLIAFLGAPTEPAVNPDDPLTADHRRALFAAYDDAFRDTTSEGRYAFTRLVLGLDPEDRVSWSENKWLTAITIGEAEKVIAALKALV
jgi:hypothetical protein